MKIGSTIVCSKEIFSHKIRGIDSSNTGSAFKAYRLGLQEVKLHDFIDACSQLLY